MLWRPPRARATGRTVGQPTADRAQVQLLVAHSNDEPPTVGRAKFQAHNCGHHVGPPKGWTVLMTTTYLNVSSASQLSADINSIDLASQADGGNGTTYVITLEAGATLTETPTFPRSISPAKTPHHQRPGRNSNGVNAYRGLFVYSGDTTIENLDDRERGRERRGGRRRRRRAGRGSAAASSWPTMPMYPAQRGLRAATAAVAAQAARAASGGGGGGLGGAGGAGRERGSGSIPGAAGGGAGQSGGAGGASGGGGGGGSKSGGGGGGGVGGGGAVPSTSRKAAPAALGRWRRPRRCPGARGLSAAAVRRRRRRRKRLRR